VDPLFDGSASPAFGRHEDEAADVCKNDRVIPTLLCQRSLELVQSHGFGDIDRERPNKHVAVGIDPSPRTGRAKRVPSPVAVMTVQVE
jgi:hypothetical protein